MSIAGTSFTSAFSGGAHMDFGVGTAGLDTVFASDYTIAVLSKFSSSNCGFLGAFTDTTAGTAIREFFISNNSGGRMFGDGDFSAGFPDPGTVGSPGLADSTWRWHVMSKATGSAHYKMNYADLSTLTWVDGESVSAANHSDNATAAGMFSTWAVYPQGFGSQDIAAICVWPSQLTTGQIHSSCTQNAYSLKGSVTPIAGWLFPQASIGSAGSVLDFMGGGANEISRPNITTSTDPASFNFSLVPQVALTPATETISPVALNPVPQPVSITMLPVPIVIAPRALTLVPGLVTTSILPAPIVLHSSLIGSLPVSTSVVIRYDVDIPVSKPFVLEFDARVRVSTSTSLIHDVRMGLQQGKVFSLLYDVRQLVNRLYDIRYGVVVPISSPKSVDLAFGVRASVSDSVVVQYDTTVIGITTISKSLSIVYHTLVTPTVDEVLIEPFYQDPVPPAIVTTSF